MAELALHFLGPPLIELDGQPVQLGRHKAVALLAYLALTRQPHSRDALATLLWPELDQSHARGQLRRTLSLLNRTLGDEWLAVDRETVEWAAQAEAWIDREAMRERMAACAEHGHPSQETCSECVPLLEGAVDLYHDGFLAGFTLPDAPAFDEWQFFEGEELREQVSDALQRLAHWYGDHGECESAIPYARQWLALDPLHEPAHRELMALYARSRQRAAALRQYAECERGLGEELGVLPSPETVELYEAIRAGRELSPQAPAGVVDLPEPSSSRRHHLPLQGTPFVGRRQELDELERLLAHSAEARLVTVVGPGGMGKTRLALEAAARQLDRYPDGVWFVSLASVQSAGAIVPTVAQVLGVSFFGMDPPGQQLLRYLRGKRMLLLLDNLEHLLGGVDLLMEILRTAPEVQLLVTSRVRLNMREEQAFTLGGMDYPQLPAGAPVTDDVRRHGSVVLFVRSAQRARSAFKLGQAELPHVARICQLAQGMPLAILLAAAWVPALTPAEIAAEMERSLDFLAADWRDEPERHHSMRAVFDATWGMLTEKERRVFARLSVFCGGFTREAAQAVAGADLRALISLVNKSLLQRGRGGRYEIHELLRQYAAGKLEEVPEEKKETLDLYADYYVEFLARKEMELWRGDRQEAWSEIDNIRAAWHWAMACRRVSDIHRPLHSLFRLYHGSGLFQEGEDICSDAVQALRSQGKETLDEDQAAALGLALLLQVHFAGYCDHADRREELVREGLSILGKLGVRREVALAYTLGDAVYSLADGEQLYEKAIEICRELACYPAMVGALVALSFRTLFRGRYREATRYGQEALALSKRFGARPQAAVSLAVLGHVASVQEDYAEARRCYKESLTLFGRTGWGVGRLCSHLGDVAMAVGDYAEAKAYHQRALARYQEVAAYWRKEPGMIGGSWGVPVSLQRLGDVALAVGDGQGARQHYGQSVQMAIDHPYVELQLYVLLGPARLWEQEGRAEEAVELAALARHHPASVEEARDKADRLLERLRPELSTEAYAAAEARGRARDLEATLRELLIELGSAPRSKAITGGGGEVDTAGVADIGRSSDA